MKKTIIYSTLFLLSLFTSCSESAEKTEVKTENSGTTVKEPVPNNIVDTSKRTSVSVGSNGAGVKSKNTEVNVDKNGVKVGTKKVKVEINR
ncbi:MAG: hypothetical protein ACR2KX_02520 [Chitinophagaceae bacterium]|jgi:hypothetical protein